jgi:hypothetical protein
VLSAAACGGGCCCCGWGVGGAGAQERQKQEQKRRLEQQGVQNFLRELGQEVSRPFPSGNRSILTEIYLCHACSCQEILRAETAGQDREEMVREYIGEDGGLSGTARQQPWMMPLALSRLCATGDDAATVSDWKWLAWPVSVFWS